MKNNKYSMFMWLLAAAVLLLSGCGGAGPKAPVPYIHTVQWSGETLSQIAEWYTGDNSYTANLLTVNPTLSTDILPLGTNVTIPENLLKNREPMPEDFLTKGQETSEPKDEGSPSYFVHTVVHSGESISIIAAWYTGDLQNWKILAAVNPQLNPNMIKLGDRINIPEEMMVTHEEMPLSHVHKYVSPTPKRTVAKPVVQKKTKLSEPITAETITEEMMEEEAESESIEDVPEPPAKVEKALPIFGPK